MFGSAVIKGISDQRIVFFNKKHKKSHFFEAFVKGFLQKTQFFEENNMISPCPGAIKKCLKK